MTVLLIDANLLLPPLTESSTFNLQDNPPTDPTSSSDDIGQSGHGVSSDNEDLAHAALRSSAPRTPTTTGSKKRPPVDLQKSGSAKHMSRSPSMASFVATSRQSSFRKDKVRDLLTFCQREGFHVFITNINTLNRDAVTALGITPQQNFLHECTTINSNIEENMGTHDAIHVPGKLGKFITDADVTIERSDLHLVTDSYELCNMAKNAYKLNATQITPTDYKDGKKFTDIKSQLISHRNSKTAAVPSTSSTTPNESPNRDSGNYPIPPNSPAGRNQITVRRSTTPPRTSTVIDYYATQFGDDDTKKAEANVWSSFILKDIHNGTRTYFNLLDILVLGVSIILPLFAFEWFAERTDELILDADHNRTTAGWGVLLWTAFILVQIPFSIFSTLNLQRNLNALLGLVINSIFDKNSKLANEHHSFMRYFVGACFGVFVGVFSALATVFSSFRVLFITIKDNAMHLPKGLRIFSTICTFISALSTNFAFANNTAMQINTDWVSRDTDGYGYTVRLTLKNMLAAFPGILDKVSRENPTAVIALADELRLLDHNTELGPYELLCVRLMLFKEFMKLHGHIDPLEKFTKKNIGNYETLKKAMFAIVAFLSTLPSFSQAFLAAQEAAKHGSVLAAAMLVLFILIVFASFTANVLINYDSLRKLSSFFLDSLSTIFPTASKHLGEIHQASKDFYATKLGKKTSDKVPYQIYQQLKPKSIIVDHLTESYLLLHERNFCEAGSNLVDGMLELIKNLLSLFSLAWYTVVATLYSLNELRKGFITLIGKGACDLRKTWNCTGNIEKIESVFQIVLAIAAAIASAAIAYTFPVFGILRIPQAAFNGLITLAISNRALFDAFNKFNRMAFDSSYQLSADAPLRGPKEIYENQSGQPVRQKRIVFAEATKIKLEAGVLQNHVSDLKLEHLYRLFPDPAFDRNPGIGALNEKHNAPLYRLSCATV